MSSLGNIHQLVSGAIATVNPFVNATLQRSTGYTVAPGGVKAPTYQSFAISAQVQALTFKDIAQLDGLNIQGVRRKMYITGAAAGLVRDNKEGGDLVTFPAGTLPEGNTWLVALVFEAWPLWTSCALTLQNGA